MNYEKEYRQINDLIQQAQNILIIPHIDPDPDGIGSSLALALALKQKSKQCHIALQESLSGKNTELFPGDRFYIYPSDIEQHYDLIFTTDIGSQNRVGVYLNFFDLGIPSVNLDHHIDNEKFGDINIVDINYSSTAELTYELLKNLDIKMNHEIARALYTGIVYDTGSFRYSLTTKRTHQLVGELLDYNIDTNDIYEKLFEGMTESSLRLNNKVASTLELFHNGKIALTHLKKSFVEECSATDSDSSGLVKIGSGIKGVDFSIYINEKNENLTKVSLRSKGNFKVNEIAKSFGGGGHEKAAGFTIEENFEEVKQKIIQTVIPKYVKEG